MNAKLWTLINQTVQKDMGDEDATGYQDHYHDTLLAKVGVKSFKELTKNKADELVAMLAKHLDGTEEIGDLAPF